MPEYAEWLIAHLPAVAVGTVKKVATPPFTRPLDLREFVRCSGRNHDVSSLHRAATGETDDEAGVDCDNLIRRLDAVVGRLFGAGGKGAGSVASRSGEEAMRTVSSSGC